MEYSEDEPLEAQGIGFMAVSSTDERWEEK
jgi:hypothetical protein